MYIPNETFLKKRLTFSIPIGILERRGGDAMDNRKTIMQCALNLFSDKGYDSVGVQEIVTAAGITKPTLYYYFKSKHGLLEALIQEKGELLMRQLTQAVGTSGDISEPPAGEGISYCYQGTLPPYPPVGMDFFQPLPAALAEP